MKRRTGFSLAELAIALGILTFAVVAIYGLLIVGMRISGDAHGNLRAAEILYTVTDDYRAWQRMSNQSVYTPSYKLPTGYDPTTDRFSSTAVESITIYQDGSKSSGLGGGFLVVAQCRPLDGGLASRVQLTVLRGAGVQADFTNEQFAFSNHEHALFSTVILVPPRK